ncbi:uridine kinase [Tenacibaculum sp. UWU-22]|uniref:uridine kinase n=1 Tax=Tenacibaculum sp. UWU-22 TaxID=3234187 RepID=UPI0034DB4EC2
MKNRLFIGITGGTGSGKTTMVNQIINQLPADTVCVISQDSYYKANTNLSYQERSKINFDNPKAIDFELLIKHIKQLKKGNTIEQPIYSFITHNRTLETIKTPPKKVIIIEGILIFNNKELRNLCDIKVFIDVDADERLIRRIRRDINERGRDLNEILTRYQETLKPMHKQFIEPTKKFADIIIPNNQPNTVATNFVKTVISEHL